MDVTGLLIFLALSAHALAVLRQFHFVSLRKSWTEAQRYCRDTFDDLVSIENQDDWAKVSKLIKSSGQTEAWIGLYDDVNNWRWSLDNTSLYQRDLGDWFVLEADNSQGRELCVRMFNGTFHDKRCTGVSRFVCYNGPTNSNIAIQNMHLRWEDARNYCRDNYTDLAIIRNHEELNRTKIRVNPNVNYWVGLSRCSWRWSDKSRSSYRFWMVNEPNSGNQSCAMANVHGWSDHACHTELPFVCSGAARKVLKVTLKTDGSVNLNDPLVQEAVLKQVEKDLRKQGINQEIRLRWKKQPRGGVFKKTEL